MEEIHNKKDESKIETGGATGTDKPEHVKEMYLVQPILTKEEEQKRNLNILKHHFQKNDDNENSTTDPILWPQFGSTVSDFSDAGLLSKSFPTLFPYGTGDVTCLDRLSKVTLDAAGKHYLKYCVNKKEIQLDLKNKFESGYFPDVDPSLESRIDTIFDTTTHVSCHQWIYLFLKNQCFLHFIQNTVECQRLFSQRSVWLKKHPKFLNLSEDKISTLIIDGGTDLKELLSSIQCFNANINGSNQYLYKKKLLDKLKEQHGLCTMWFMLSIGIGTIYTNCLIMTKTGTQQNFHFFFIH